MLSYRTSIKANGKKGTYNETPQHNQIRKWRKSEYINQLWYMSKSIMWDLSEEKKKKKIITAKQNNAIKTIYYHLAQKLSDIHVGKAGIQCVIVTILKQVCLYLWYMYIYLSHKILHISL